jgi:hypothetical protein
MCINAARGLFYVTSLEIQMMVSTDNKTCYQDPGILYFDGCSNCYSSDSQVVQLNSVHFIQFLLSNKEKRQKEEEQK